MAVTTLGMAVLTFRGDGTAINAFLFLSMELSHEQAARVEGIAMGIILACSLAALLRPHWAFILPVGVYALAEAVARERERGYAFSEWALTAQAPRYLAPLALVLLAAHMRSPSKNSWSRIGAVAVLRIALAMVFAVHGLESLRAHGAFIDLIISSGVNLLDVRIPERAATQALQVIGWIDLGVAAAILVWPRAGVLWWAAFWGALTAFSRMTSYGFGAYPDVLVRATHVLGPIALWLLTRPSIPQDAQLATPASAPQNAGQPTEHQLKDQRDSRRQGAPPTP